VLPPRRARAKSFYLSNRKAFKLLNERSRTVPRVEGGGEKMSNCRLRGGIMGVLIIQ